MRIWLENVGGSEVLYTEEELFYAYVTPPQGMLLDGFCKDQKVTEKPSLAF